MCHVQPLALHVLTSLLQELVKMISAEIGSYIVLMIGIASTCLQHRMVSTLGSLFLQPLMETHTKATVHEQVKGTHPHPSSHGR